MTANNNNNTVKPIMVGDITLTQLEQCWDSSLYDDPNDKSEAYDELLKTFQEVCTRLRKEVKRHKKAKLSRKELELLLEHERAHARSLLLQNNELVRERTVIDANFKLMADSFVELLKENKNLKLENQELENYLDDEELQRYEEIREERRNRRLDG